MTKKNRPIVRMLCFSICFLCLGMETPDNGPVATVKSLLEAVKSLSEAKDKETEARAVQRVSQGFDLTGISKACLRGTWDSLSEQERKKFVTLFQDILEKVAYPKSADFFKGTEIEVEEVQTQGNRAEVSTLVIHPEEGMVEVMYCLEPVEGKWLIKDLQLDGVSLIFDLRSQMQKIIREKSYQELKRRMQEKLNS